MQDLDLLKSISDLLESQVQCVLATVDGVQPCLHLMAYGFSDSLSEIYVASYADTRKVNNMLAQPAVSLLWDNRTVNQQDHVLGFALNAVGKARKLTGAEHQAAANLLIVRNASLAELLASDKVVTFAVAVSAYTFVKGYRDVYEYQPIIV